MHTLYCTLQNKKHMLPFMQWHTIMYNVVNFLHSQREGELDRMLTGVCYSLYIEQATQWENATLCQPPF